ncbi:unnamed protein product [Symbiodinium pilosum]|uniref:Uncharacterized protein n=1 Tax=Symbiodinium pilosum TaxID=2952 RepID=A0A812PV95_SYMPI|nr:unnamed protein product [Symbiodinium pilosum]
MAAPRSYRSFAAALRQEEALELRLRADAREAQVESEALRAAIYSEALQQSAEEESAEALLLQLQEAEAQAAATWAEYEEPLAQEANARATLRLQLQELEEQHSVHAEAECRLLDVLEARRSEVAELGQNHEAHEEHHGNLHQQVLNAIDLLERMREEHCQQQVALSHARTGASRHQEDLSRLMHTASTHQGRVHAASAEIAHLALEMENMLASGAKANEVGWLQQELQEREEQRYPTPGIIYDKASQLYLEDPSYWNYWDRATKPGYPADDQLESYVTSPPNIWWEQRRLWRDKWKQLGVGDEGQTTFPYDGRPPPGWNGRCVKEPGLLKADWGRPKLWWEWLEGPPDPLDWKSGLKSAVKSMAGDFLSNFFDNDKCTLPIGLDTPISKYWKESGQAGYDLEQPGAPWPRRGTFRREKADQKVYADWDQEKWLAEHTLRRPTMKGFPKAFTPHGLERATPRFEDRFAEDEPGTLDPRLPRPAGLPDLNKYTESQREEMFHAFDGNSGALGVGDDMMTKMLGGDMAEMKAYKRLMKVEPQWLNNFLEGKVSAKEHPVGYGIDEKTFQTEKEPEHPVWEPTPPPWHPRDMLKKIPSFEKIWNERMERALRAAANMSRFSGRAAREAQDDLDHQWQHLSKPLDKSARGLLKRAEAEAEAERASEPPLVTAADEAEVRMNALASANAADTSGPADDPHEQFAAVPASKAKGADTEIPQEQKVDAKEASARPAQSTAGASAGNQKLSLPTRGSAASSKKKDYNALSSEDAYTSIAGRSKVDPVALTKVSSGAVLLLASGVLTPQQRALSSRSFL